MRICMNLLPVRDGTPAEVHYHGSIKTIAYLLDSDNYVHYGEDICISIIRTYLTMLN